MVSEKQCLQSGEVSQIKENTKIKKVYIYNRFGGLIYLKSGAKIPCVRVG
jgi:hypothetical protein